MPIDMQNQAAEPKPHEDEPLPAASDDKVLDETARLAREGRRELESDPKERGSDIAR